MTPKYMFNGKGQVSSEMLIAFIIVLLVLFFTILFSLNMRHQALFMNELSESTDLCYAIAMNLSKINAGTKASMKFSIDRAIFISGNEITVGDVHCNFFGNLQETSLAPGEILIKKDNSLEVKNV